MRLGIIGSCGRGDDANKLDSKYFRMMEIISKTIMLTLDAKYLVSGGAAISDQIAVVLALKYNIPLKLHLPAEFDCDTCKFITLSDSTFDVGRIANFYHKQFEKKTGVKSLKQIKQVIQENHAEVIITPGFKERNTQVAKDSDALLAFTFGQGPLLKDGGSQDTFSKFLKLKSGRAFHFCLNNKELFEIFR